MIWKKPFAETYDFKGLSIEPIHETKAYDVLAAFRDDDQGGDCCFMLNDVFDERQVVNLLYPVIEEEIFAKWRKNKLGEE